MTETLHHYILNDDKTVKAVDLMTWAEYIENNNIRIKRDIIDENLVSTVFLGLDHSSSFGPPLIFETMVFPSTEIVPDIYCDRYSTYDEALIGHQKACQRVKDRCKDNDND